MSLPYSRQSISPEDAAAVAEALAGELITTGPRVAEFERAIAAATGARFAVAVCNGTAALHAAVLALGLPAGFRGITSPLTFAASANCILYAGGRVDFADIEKGGSAISLEEIEETCRRQGPTQLVIPVSYAGIPADLPALALLAQRHGFRVIEDAAHSLGSRYQHQGVWHASGSCAHSDLAILSFHPVKNITTAEGGAVTTNNEHLYQRLLEIRNHGMVRDPARLCHPEDAVVAGRPCGWYYEVQQLGFNFRLSDLHAALGLSQLRRLEAFKRRRTELAARYNQAFASEPRLRVPNLPENRPVDPCFHLYPLRVATRHPERDRLRLYDALRENGITAQVHYIPVHWHPLYRGLGFKPGDFPESESFYRGELSLPLFPDLREQQQDSVIHIVLETATSFSPP